MTDTPSIGQALNQASNRLRRQTESAHRLEAEALLSQCLERPRSHLFAWPEQILTRQQWQEFQALLARRLAGEPLAYIFGHREFWSLNLLVTPDTLIPRPETELLVELSLERLAAGRPARVLELGTGSGAISAALASERPDCLITASDASEVALTVAEQNFSRLGLANVRVRQGDWYAVLDPGEIFDVIVSNPPYIACGDPHLDQGDLPREPRSALVSGGDGLDAIRRIAPEACTYLVPGGWLLLEHGCEQGEAVRALLRQGGLEQIHSKRDLAGLERVSLGARPED